MAESSKELILKLLRERGDLKLETANRIAAGFLELKKALSKLELDLKASMLTDHLQGIPISFIDKGDFNAEFNIVDDTMIYLMHTNVFTFESNHEIWKSSYVQQDHARSYCGKIYVYNFLTDSFKYKRKDDIGYLVARIFINKENHFFVEGKRQLGFLYNDFANAVFDADAARQVAESTLLYSLDFDPYTPPYEHMSLLTVEEMIESNMQLKIATGKRLGFRFKQAGNELT